ncbi:MAG: CotH kinase family protein [Lachnospiraceae bacterium]|nr:CotH kinase family protein [Lachnospiraceae bacterium]
MRNKRTQSLCVIFIFSIAMLLLLKLDIFRIDESGIHLSGNKAHPTVDYVEEALGVPVVEDMSFLNGKELCTSGSNPGVLFEETMLPYDEESETLYLSQSLADSEWVGSLSTALDGYYLCAVRDEYWDRKQEAIREGYPFELFLVGDSDYYSLNLVVSGMPTLTIDTESKVQIQDGEELSGIIRVFNPDIGVEKYEIHESYVSYHIKGGTTRKFEKKGYALKLQDKKGNNVAASLLGMRADNSWKLNALYTDNNRIREKTAADIWEQFCEATPEVKQDGARLEYVELIINNDYRGIYCLVEPIDEVKLGLDKNDVLYKVVGWTLPEQHEFFAAAEQGAYTAGGIRINYPNEMEDSAAAWYPMQDYSERFYENPELDYEKALSTVDVRNLSDVFMFLMVTTASDNDFKNLYFAAEVSEGNEYVMTQIPWDLDYTFGNYYDGGVVNLVAFDDSIDGLFADSTLPRLKFANLEEIGPAFLDRWNRYRESFLSTDAILELLQTNRDYVVETGALQRDAARWPEVPVNGDITPLLQYQMNRMLYLDDYFVRWATE